MKTFPYSATFIGDGAYSDPVTVCHARADGMLWCMADYGSFWAAPSELDLDPVTLPGGYPRPGFSSKRKASEYWHDTLGGRNDRARFVLEAGRWYIEEASGWNWHRWDAAEYVPHALLPRMTTFVPVTPAGTPLFSYESRTAQGAIANLLKAAAHMPYVATWESLKKRGYTIGEVGALT